LSQQFRQSSARTRTPVPLRNFQDIEGCLRGDTLDAIVANLAAQSF
jgi:hypothetical protein